MATQKTPVNPQRLESFVKLYSSFLKEEYANNPEAYGFTADQLPEVTARMAAAIEQGSFNKDSNTFKRTCRVLGIKHTYAAIAAYLRG